MTTTYTYNPEAHTVTRSLADALHAQIEAATNAQTDPRVADLNNLQRACDALANLSADYLAEHFDALSEVRVITDTLAGEVTIFDASAGEATARSLRSILSAGLDLDASEEDACGALLDAWQNAPRPKNSTRTTRKGDASGDSDLTRSLGFTVFAYHAQTGEKVLARTSKANLNSLRHYALKAAEEAGVERPAGRSEEHAQITEAARKVMEGEATSQSAHGFTFTRSA